MNRVTTIFLFLVLSTVIGKGADYWVTHRHVQETASVSLNAPNGGLPHTINLPPFRFSNIRTNSTSSINGKITDTTSRSFDIESIQLDFFNASNKLVGTELVNTLPANIGSHEELPWKVDDANKLEMTDVQRVRLTIKYK